MSTRSGSDDTKPVLPLSLHRRLYLPAYTTQEAAHLAGTTAQTVTRWCVGYTARGRRHPSVVTPKPPWQPLSYLELVEVAFVGTCRDLLMPLQRIRKAHEYLAKVFSEEYPFATLRLKADGRHILKAFEQAEEEPMSMVVTDQAGQLVWAPQIETRLEQFDWDYGLALPWFPRGKDIRILLDPRISFGAPIVEAGGVATAVLRERYEGGETVPEIADDFVIASQDVLTALRFEGLELAA